MDTQTRKQLTEDLAGIADRVAATLNRSKEHSTVTLNARDISVLTSLVASRLDSPPHSGSGNHPTRLRVLGVLARVSERVSAAGAATTVSVAHGDASVVFALFATAMGAMPFRRK